MGYGNIVRTKGGTALKPQPPSHPTTTMRAAALSRRGHRQIFRSFTTKSEQCQSSMTNEQ